MLLYVSWSMLPWTECKLRLLHLNVRRLGVPYHLNHRRHLFIQVRIDVYYFFPLGLALAEFLICFPYDALIEHLAIQILVLFMARILPGRKFLPQFFSAHKQLLLWDIFSSISYRQQVRPLYCLPCIGFISTHLSSNGE